jgi:hypothetical protein
MTIEREEDRAAYRSDYSFRAFNFKALTNNADRDIGVITKSASC